MRFACPVSNLQSALSVAIKALAPRPSAPILDGVLLETCPEGLRLICTDLSFGIETTLEATVSEEGRVVLPGKLLAEIIRKLPPGEVSVEIREGTRATIRCMGSRTTLAGMAPDEYPPLPEVERNVGFSLEQGVLRDMIQKTAFAIATDESRPILTGSLLEARDNTLTMVSLDSFRLALHRCAISGNEAPFSAVIPGKVLSELSKILEGSDDPVTLSLNASHVLADIGSTRLIARLLEGEFIQYQKIMPTEWTTRMEVSSRSLGEAIDRASLIAREGKNYLVRFHIEKDKLQISSNAELGDVNEEVDVITEGKDLDIAFNVRYMSDMLKVLEEETIHMNFQSNVSPCVIKPADGDQYEYLVLPVRFYYT